ncbi:metal ABC transporter ATP-binding protein [Homoserinibacter sp. GY 40078]|uniref:metal ABC transporter ATP-binding protein n=1 Tax=Homoserinibacter sp. GY 40078 TaxID=2603275 RepID=UPI0011C938BD|nr:ATP-binding cassette domain-containing protein [Homoserinibacter sp. GY 40078]TXK18949.1 ATP-binding cassette domain-containing protein [Homoserinibacter sp. GY 40078]
MTDPVLSVRGARLALGARTLWTDLDLDVAPGEFVAVLGANGSGKTSLLRAILGEHRLSDGGILVDGRPARRGDRRIGYIPQQRGQDPALRIRGRDLVGLGVDGHRWGLPLPGRERRARIDVLLASVGGSHYANAPVALLSGGEQQRLRVAQALAGDPLLMLCDEPLASLDLRAQRVVSELIDRHRRERGFGVMFVTHDVNPILGMVDRVLYLAGGRFRIGTPDEVLRSEVLSELYQAEVDVVRTRGRVVIVGAPDHTHHEHELEVDA